MDKEKQILKKLSDEDGLILVRKAEASGVDRYKLSYLARKDKIDRVSHGVYALKDEIVDEYVLLQKTSNRIIYSYQTALYFHNLTDRVPSQIHISVPQGYNASRLKKKYNNLVVHYVKKEFFELGSEVGPSPLGGEIVRYDKERTICDIVKDREKVDVQIFTDAIKLYFSESKIYSRNLIKYAREFKIEEDIRKYLEVLT